MGTFLPRQCFGATSHPLAFGTTWDRLRATTVVQVFQYIFVVKIKLKLTEAFEAIGKAEKKSVDGTLHGATPVLLVSLEGAQLVCFEGPERRTSGFGVAGIAAC